MKREKGKFIMRDYEDDDYENNRFSPGNAASKVTNIFDKIPRWAKVIVASIVGLFVIVSVFMMFSGMFYFQTKAGYTYHYQNTLFGTEDVYFTPDVHFKIPIFSSIEEYKQVLTVSYGSNSQAAILAALKKGNTISAAMVKVLFADTYTADLPGTFRFKLPSTRDEFLTLHHDFRSFDNLVSSLVEKTSMDVLINTATQYTGEEFFLGAINQFKAAVLDQLRKGVYVTDRRKVEVDETGLTPVGLGQEDSNKLSKQKKLVWKTVPLTDDKGKYLRQENPLAQYGISTMQFTMGRPIPEPQLDTLLIDKKTLVADRIKTVQQQETAKEQAKTAQLMEEIDRTKAKQSALKTKELSVIAIQQQVEEAEKQADKEKVEYNKTKALQLILKQQELEVAEFDKKTIAVKKSKDLANAKADRDIQEQAYEAAKFEGRAIKEIGLAEAAVQQAKYDAYDVQLYIAELQKDISIQLYRNLGNFKVEMPTIVSGDSAGGLPNNLKILSDFAALGALEKAKALNE